MPDNTWSFDGEKMTGPVQCEMNGGRYVIHGRQPAGRLGFASVTLRSEPKASRVRDVVNESDNIEETQAIVYAGDSLVLDILMYRATGGKAYVTVSGGKTKIAFSDLPSIRMQGDGPATAKISGTLVCP